MSNIREIKFNSNDINNINRSQKRKKIMEENRFITYIKNTIESSIINNQVNENKMIEIYLSDITEYLNYSFAYYIFAAKSVFYYILNNSNLKVLLTANNYENTKINYRNAFKFQLLIIKHFMDYQLSDMVEIYLNTTIECNNDNQNKQNDLNILNTIIECNKNLLWNTFEDKNLFKLINNKINDIVNEDLSDITVITRIHLLYVFKSDDIIFNYLKNLILNKQEEELNTIITKSFQIQYDIIVNKILWEYKMDENEDKSENENEDGKMDEDENKK